MTFAPRGLTPRSKDSRLWRHISAIRLFMKPTAYAILVLALSLGTHLAKDAAPPSAEQPWAPPRIEQYERELAARAAREKGAGRMQVDPRHIYTLPELIDLAQRN